MDSSSSGWDDGLLGGMEGLEQPLDKARMGEDWEDWLRWDPAAEPTSPEDDPFQSSSSKNDSPLQDAAVPVVTGGELFTKDFVNDTLAPPLVVEDDTLNFGAGYAGNTDTFVFGTGNDVPGFDFDVPSYYQMPPSMPKLDTSWNMPLPTQSENVTLSALSNDRTLPTASSASTNSVTSGTSPQSASQPRASMSSQGSPGKPEPPPKKRGGRKRKIPVEEHNSDKNGDSADGDEPPAKKGSHNVIEKRYRNNLSDKIVELRNAVPTLRAMRRANCGEDAEDLEGLTAAHKLNKATVMAKATEYIKHLEKRNKSMAEEMAAMKARLAAVEAAIGKNRDRQASISTSPPNRPRQISSSSSQNGAPGFLNIPQEQARYGQPVMQQQYTQQQQTPTYARPPNPPVDAQNQPRHVYGRGGGVMNKVMLGAMASIMVMEGFSEQQQGDTKQLFAVPTLFRRGLDESAIMSPTALARQAGVPLLKILCVVGVLAYMLLPLLAWTPRSKRKTRPALRLPQVPSLASPVEVRRNAWLTAMQTVYVPKHFLLEVVAVTSKMFSLSLRRLIGTDTWNVITGMKEEEEAARIKAWDIAIDAQLAGGDAEVSYYRLLLTLMASGTLPDSPARLMQKAVHFRVFFWEVAHAGYGNMIGFKTFTEKVGKYYWESARKLQKELVDAKAQGRPSHDDSIDLLPDHLACLVTLDCDDVLTDEMIQRAWNLAWDKPSAFNTTANAARDGVIEDHAIRSPLDAVAAWYAHMTIDDALLDALGEHPSVLNNEYYLNLAVSVAPPASATQLRALTAKAVLSTTHREANIRAALEALPVVSPGGDGMNLVRHTPAAPEVHSALTLAKLLSLLSPNSTPLAHRRAHDMLSTLHIPLDTYSLLTAVATYSLLKLASTDRWIPFPAVQGLEDMAVDLRAWVGTSAGCRAGLDPAEGGRVIDLCLGFAKKVGGWDGRDSGYGSAVSSPVSRIATLAV